MRAIGYQQPGPASVLSDIELSLPTATGRDVLVEVKAVSVNPVDYKVRRSARPEEGQWKVIGYDAAGIVRAVGPDVVLLREGDEVFYAGSIVRPGTNSQFHLVDERIVGKKPRSLDWAEAAALPLTSITAWEALFDRIDVRRPVPGAAPALLIIGGPGGVGSIAIQLARALTNLTIIATASRPETEAWVRQLGAHHVINHNKPLAAQVAALGIGAPGLVFTTNRTGEHSSEIAELLAPQGRLAVIDELPDASVFMRKSISIHWELMFTRPQFETADISEQGKLLNEVSRLVDARVLRTTLTKRLSPINAENLQRAHSLIEQGSVHGKIALEDFSSTLSEK